jgi:hypothetical protein
MVVTCIDKVLQAALVFLSWYSTANNATRGWWQQNWPPPRVISPIVDTTLYCTRVPDSLVMCNLLTFVYINFLLWCILSLIIAMFSLVDHCKIAFRFCFRFMYKAISEDYTIINIITPCCIELSSFKYWPLYQYTTLYQKYQYIIEYIIVYSKAYNI